MKIMNNELIYIDLFSGVGGFHLGFEQAGMKFSKSYFSEIDKHAIAVYKYHFKESEYVGSVTDVSGTALRERHQKAKFIITFGFPCQDLSIAGQGKGLDGARSGLFYEAIRIVKEVRPEVFIFENVKGLLSSNNGKDFELVLRTIADIGLYECEWQLVNTSWILPQNRERIYFVGHLGGHSKPGVFPFRKSDSEFSKQQRRITESESPGHACGNYKGMNAVCIDKNGKNSEITGTIDANYYKGLDGNFGSRPAIRVSNIMNKIGNIYESGGENGNVYSPYGISPAIKSGETSTKGNGGIGSNNSPKIVVPVLTPDRKEKRQNWRRFKENGEPAFTLNTQDMHGMVVTKNYIQWDTSGKGYNSQQDRAHYEDGIMGTTPSGRTENKVNILQNNSQIRRLTEIECERLQGFPDNWTEYGDYDGEIKKVSKTQRYKQMGNAVTVDWPRMIAGRLMINLF